MLMLLLLWYFVTYLVISQIFWVDIMVPFVLSVMMQHNVVFLPALVQWFFFQLLRYSPDDQKESFLYSGWQLVGGSTNYWE